MAIKQFLRDFKIYIDPHYDMETFIAEYGMWEPHIVMVINYFVQPGSICADIGANAGYHTLAMAQRGGIVYAFEPDTENYNRLLANLALNPSVVSQINTRKIGLSNRPGTLTVFKSGDAEHRGNSYLGMLPDQNKWTNDSAEREPCVVSTIDEEFAGKRLDFLKIDVEGMELEVLQGAVQSIAANKPTIVYESLMNNFSEDKIREIEELLGSLGYHFFYVDLQSYKLKPTRYPDLKHDTVAVHSSLLTQYLDHMELTAA